MPRKTHGSRRVRGVILLASMRPRPDAAENPGEHGRVPAGGRGFNEAAARCRGKRRIADEWLGDVELASMRPRPDAAENVHRSDGDGPCYHAGFNEAAARCRGKPCV